MRRPSFRRVQCVLIVVYLVVGAGAAVVHHVSPFTGVDNATCGALPAPCASVSFAVEQRAADGDSVALDAAEAHIITSTVHVQGKAVSLDAYNGREALVRGLSASLFQFEQAPVNMTNIHLVGGNSTASGGLASAVDVTFSSAAPYPCSLSLTRVVVRESISPSAPAVRLAVSGSLGQVCDILFEDTTFADNQGAAFSFSSTVNLAGTYVTMRRFIGVGCLYFPSYFTGGFLQYTIRVDCSKLLGVRGFGLNFEVYAPASSTFTFTNNEFEAKVGEQHANFITQRHIAGLYNAWLFANNTFRGGGQGVWIDYNSGQQIDDCTHVFRNCTFDSNIDGAIRIGGGQPSDPNKPSIVEVDSRRFLNTSRRGGGGAIQLLNPPHEKMEVNNGNYASQGTTVFLVDIAWQSFITVRKSAFIGCRAYGFGALGGAINLEHGMLTIEDSTFSPCSSTAFGGALYIGKTGSLTAVRSTFVGNEAVLGEASTQAMLLSLFQIRLANDGVCPVKGLSTVGSIALGALVPLFVVVFLAVVWVTQHFQLIFETTDAQRMSLYAAVMRAGILCYSSVTQVTFCLLNCVDIGGDLFLLADATIACYQPWQEFFFFVASILFLFPLAMIALAMRESKVSSGWLHTWQLVIVAPYKDAYRVWDGVALLQVLLFHAFAIFITDESKRVLTTTSFALICLCLQAILRPFTSAFSNVLQTVVLFSVAMISLLNLPAATLYAVAGTEDQQRRNVNTARWQAFFLLCPALLLCASLIWKAVGIAAPDTHAALKRGATSAAMLLRRAGSRTPQPQQQAPADDDQSKPADESVELSVTKEAPAPVGLIRSSSQHQQEHRQSIRDVPDAIADTTTTTNNNNNNSERECDIIDDANDDIDLQQDRLPPGWECYRTDDGIPYYLNPNGETQWTAPPRR